MNILLINPTSLNAFEAFGFVFPPLGLLYVAATAEKEGYHIKVEDLCISKKRASHIDFSQYDVVGITSDTRRFNGALEVAERAHEKGCTVIMGGAHPPFVDDEIIMKGWADFVIRGEGEITFPELLNALKSNINLLDVKGISYRNNDKVVRTQQRQLITDLDSVPFPARHLVNMEDYKRAGLKYGGERPVALMSSSRGCTGNCSFCITPQMYGKKWRARSAESVVAEIEELYHHYNYRAIAFCDDNFTVSPKRVMDICTMIHDRDLDLWWWCLSTQNTLINNEQMIQAMAQSGAKTIYVGIESAASKTLKEYNKNVAKDTSYEAIRLLRKNGIQVFASYIIGGLNDNVISILKTIKLARSLDTEVAQFTILTPYPGTAIYSQLRHRLRHKKWYLYDGVHLVFKHKSIPYVVMELLLLAAYGSFYARGLKAVKGFIKALIHNSPFFKRQKKK